VHNTFCPTVLSREFQQRFDEIRRNRSKISHLGIYKRSIDPKFIIDTLQLQYRELYPSRRWMEDRLHFATLHRWADYGDSDFNERTALFNELWHLLPGLSDSQFKWLMQHDRKEPRFICHPCALDARLGGHQPYASDVPTAYRVGQDLSVWCMICDNVSKMKVAPCPRHVECPSELLSADPATEGACMICGWDETDVARHKDESKRGIWS
jgi:hypothetical protein